MYPNVLKLILCRMSSHPLTDAVTCASGCERFLSTHKCSHCSGANGPGVPRLLCWKVQAFPQNRVAASIWLHF